MDVNGWLPILLINISCAAIIVYIVYFIHRRLS